MSFFPLTIINCIVKIHFWFFFEKRRHWFCLFVYEEISALVSYEYRERGGREEGGVSFGGGRCEAAFSPSFSAAPFSPYFGTTPKILSAAANFAYMQQTLVNKEGVLL